MQSLTIPTGTRNPNGHTAAEIANALKFRTGGRQMTFRYELLTSANVLIGELDNVISGEVDLNYLADIKRTARFRVRDNGLIDFLSDRIKPYVRVWLPPYGVSDYVEWPQGVFLLSSPAREADASDAVTRDVQAYDALQVYLDDLVTDRYTVAASASYTSTVSALLGSIAKNITASTATVPTAKEWEPGTSKLKIINELLGAINYESLSFDEEGTAIVKPYVAPSVRTEEWTYEDSDESVMLPEVEQELDLFDIPNKWTLVVSEPDRTPITSSYTNTDPSSPTSVPRRGRTIVDFRTEQDAADQTSLDAKAARLAFEASQVYETVDFDTGLMPIHGTNDVYRLTYSTLAVDAKYSEHTWKMPLKAGATMQHSARRVVTV